MSDYDELTKQELLEIARERDLEGRTNYNKEELVAALEANDDGDSAGWSKQDEYDADAALDLLTPSDQLDEEGNGEEGELEGPTVTAEDQENYEDLEPEAQELAAADLATHGPLTIQNPEERIMTGAVNEEQAKEQEKIYAQLPDTFTGDIPEKPTDAWLEDIKAYHKTVNGQN